MIAKFLKFLPMFLFIVSSWLSSCLDPGAAKNKAEIVKGMSQTISKTYPDINQLTIENYQKAMKEKPEMILLIDVRSDEERRTSFIPHSVSRAQFEKIFHSPQRDSLKGKTLVTFCTIGKRANDYAREIKKAGLQTAALKESLLGWVNRGLPLTKKGGESTNKVHVVSEAWNLVPEKYEAVWFE